MGSRIELSNANGKIVTIENSDDNNKTISIHADKITTSIKDRVELKKTVGDLGKVVLQQDIGLQYEWVEPQETDNGGTIINVDGNSDGSWKAIFYGPVDVKWFGAVGDGETDDTVAIQKAVDASDSINFSKGTYKVYKEPTVGNNDACITFKDKRNFKVTATDGEIFTTIHGQGVFDFDNCAYGTIENIKVYSTVGKFPDLNGTTGVGEKHISTTKWGRRRNNVDFSEGAFEGGYLTNSGCGITLLGYSHDIRVENVTVYGFNASGIQVGFKGDPDEGFAGSPANFITIDSCNLYGMYSSGVQNDWGEGMTLINSHITDIGHPDSLITDDIVDPGYGISTSASTLNNNVINVKVMNNNFLRCKRKSVDAHGVDGFTVTGNTMKYSAYGVRTSSFGYKVNKIVISDNIINSCGSVHGDVISGSDESGEGDDGVIVSNNILIDCSGRTALISWDEMSNVVVTGNITKGDPWVAYDEARGLYGIRINTNLETTTAYNITITDNQINGRLKYGIYGNHINKLICKNNIVDTTANTDNYSSLVGIYFESDTVSTLVSDNSVGPSYVTRGIRLSNGEALLSNKIGVFFDTATEVPNLGFSTYKITSAGAELLKGYDVARILTSADSDDDTVGFTMRSLDFDKCSFLGGNVTFGSTQAVEDADGVTYDFMSQYALSQYSYVVSVAAGPSGAKLKYQDWDSGNVIVNLIYTFNK